MITDTAPSSSAEPHPWQPRVDASLLELGGVLRDVELAQRRLRARFACRLGLDATEFEAFVIVGDGGRVTPREIAKVLLLSSGATTAVLDRLEKHGMIERLPHPADRRSVLVQLSPRAEAARDWLYDSFMGSVVTGVAEGRDAERLAALVAELTRVVGEVGRLADSLPPFEHGAVEADRSACAA